MLFGHQFHLPSNLIIAGTINVLVIKVSIKTPTATGIPCDANRPADNSYAFVDSASSGKKFAIFADVFKEGLNPIITEAKTNHITNVIHLPDFVIHKSVNLLSTSFLSNKSL
tara:strand:+ start:212 stop:547 length:336 start_codon:yes stop_codon:yes gene_type:complete